MSRIVFIASARKILTPPGCGSTTFFPGAASESRQRVRSCSRCARTSRRIYARASQRARQQYQPIVVGPGLLTYLDQTAGRVHQEMARKAGSIK